MSVVSIIGSHVKAGARYETDATHDDILEAPYSCTFRRVSPTQYPEHVGYALWFYDPNRFPLLQCFWTDEEARFPWDEGCSANVREAQPLLYVPKTALPA